MAIVTFNYATWIARYPEFAGVTQQVAQLYFDEATTYVRNDGGGPVSSSAILAVLLNTVTAHIAWLCSTRDANGNIVTGGAVQAPGLVGRVSSASEGSVSVSAENDYPAGSAQWWQQSKYGAAFWAMTAQYRTMRYIARPTIVVDSIYPFRSAWAAGWGGSNWNGYTG